MGTGTDNKAGVPKSLTATKRLNVTDIFRALPESQRKKALRKLRRRENGNES